MMLLLVCGGENNLSSVLFIVSVGLKVGSEVTGA